MPWSCFQPPPHALPLRRKPSRVPLLSKFRTISPRTPGRLRPCTRDFTGITLEVSQLPLQALHEFKGHSFLEFLASLGYTNAAYANRALKRTDAHTYVLADAKGKQAARAARRSSPPMYRKARSKAAAPTSRQFCPAPPLCLPPRPSPNRAAQLGIRSVVGDRQPLTDLWPSDRSLAQRLTASAAASHMGPLRKGRLAQR